MIMTQLDEFRFYFFKDGGESVDGGLMRGVGFGEVHSIFSCHC